MLPLKVHLNGALISLPVKFLQIECFLYTAITVAFKMESILKFKKCTFKSTFFFLLNAKLLSNNKPLIDLAMHTFMQQFNNILTAEGTSVYS